MERDRSTKGFRVLNMKGGKDGEKIRKVERSRAEKRFKKVGESAREGEMMIKRLSRRRN